VSDTPLAGDKGKKRRPALGDAIMKDQIRILHGEAGKAVSDSDDDEEAGKDDSSTTCAAGGWACRACGGPQQQSQR